MEGKKIPFKKGEYPSLDGMKEGEMIEFSGSGRIVGAEGGDEGDMGLEIIAMDMNASQNEATQEANRLAGRKPDSSKIPDQDPRGF